MCKPGSFDYFVQDPSLFLTLYALYGNCFAPMNSLSLFLKDRIRIQNSNKKSSMGLGAGSSFNNSTPKTQSLDMVKNGSKIVSRSVEFLPGSETKKKCVHTLYTKV